MTQHMRASIEGLLEHTDNQLGRLVEMDGKQARKLLKQKLKQGERYIPCGDCDGFDPVHGCPGHPEVNGQLLTIKAGLKFKNVHLPGCTITVLKVSANYLDVSIVSDASPNHRWIETEWILEHTQWAFERGEYFIEKEVPGDKEK